LYMYARVSTVQNKHNAQDMWQCYNIQRLESSLWKTLT